VPSAPCAGAGALTPSTPSDVVQRDARSAGRRRTVGWHWSNIPNNVLALYLSAVKLFLIDPATRSRPRPERQPIAVADLGGGTIGQLDAAVSPFRPHKDRDGFHSGSARMDSSVQSASKRRQPLADTDV
jgi:hypothetical protein